MPAVLAIWPAAETVRSASSHVCSCRESIVNVLMGVKLIETDDVTLSCVKVVNCDGLLRSEYTTL